MVATLKEWAPLALILLAGLVLMDDAVREAIARLFEAHP
jgi:hypothetical protein